MRAALASLPPEQHEVVVLSYLEGLSHGEIAERLGVPLGTVKSRMRIAYQKIRAGARGPAMTITHHLDDATLMSFAAGALPAALSAVAAAHVAMCPRCRREVARLERVGGALLGRAVARGDRSRRAPNPGRPPSVTELPAPQRADAGGRCPRAACAPRRSAGLDAVRWRWLGPRRVASPPAADGRRQARLLKVAPGRTVPEHSHGGAELTLVLRGSFHDETGRYRRGDVADLDETVEHQPIADPGPDCICLVASEKPEEFRSGIARGWQRLRGF